jgi:competence protein ComEC
MGMSKCKQVGRAPWKSWSVGILVALLVALTTGCSGEIYPPEGDTLSIVWEDGTQDKTSAGDVLELPEADSFADPSRLLQVDFLDTGESDAILMRLGDTVILIDTGESDDYATISGRLSAYGITTIHHLILTHFDNDHIGTAATILQNYRVEAVYMPDYVRDSVRYRRMMSTLELVDTTVHRVTSDLMIQLPLGKMVIRPTELYEPGMILGADDSHAAEENDFSLITTVSIGEIRLLFMGDAEQARLLEFMETEENLSFDLIKIPHHGGYDKALGDLLRETVGLRYCVVHTGDASSVKDSLVRAMQTSGAAAYYTYNGNVRFITDGVSMTVVQG